MEKGKRYNKGKNRIELIPAKPIQMLGDVYTRGAHKYSIYEKGDGTQTLGKDISLEDASKLKMIYSGADNWRLGLSWTEAIGSVERHINAYKQGEDIDPELGTYHLANAAWGLFSLMEFYKTHPEMDDRQHKYLKQPKIGLDIDDVICDFVAGYCERFNLPTPDHWSCNYDTMKHLEEVIIDDKFYLSLKPKIKASEIPFEPHCYITSRSIPKAWTEKWLQDNGFPTKPVHTIPFGASKVEIAKASGIDFYIDDRYENFVELNNAGICTFLFDSPHNQKYDVGYKRIKSFADFKERFL